MEDCKYLHIEDITPYHGDVYDHPIYKYTCKKCEIKIIPFLHCNRCKNYIKEKKISMINITMENLKEMELFLDKIKEICVEILKWKNDHGDIKNYIPENLKDISEISFEDNKIYIEVDAYEYGEYVTYYYEFPYLEIVSDDWHDDFIRKVEEERLVKEQKKKVEEELKQKEIEKLERETYERLKAKFEK